MRVIQCLIVEIKKDEHLTEHIMDRYDEMIQELCGLNNTHKQRAISILKKSMVEDKIYEALMFLQYDLYELASHQHDKAVRLHITTYDSTMQRVLLQISKYNHVVYTNIELSSIGDNCWTWDALEELDIPLEDDKICLIEDLIDDTGRIMSE